jgi:hypothetical protein
MLSTAGKMHLLLIATVLGVGLYMYLLYKELHVFERDIADLRIKVQSILAQLPNQSRIEVVESEPVGVSAAATATTVQVGVPDVSANQVEEQVEKTIDVTSDESESVTSNEIKDILTNIQDVVNEEISDDDFVDLTQVPLQEQEKEKSNAAKKPRAKAKTSDAPHVDLCLLSEDEIRKISYDNLRSLLRVHGVSNPKGTKEDLVNAAIALKNTPGKVLSVD